MITGQVIFVMTDEGRVSKRTRGTYSGLAMEGGSPPFNYFPW
ncbi:MAG TPA: hypothetical protein VNO35_27720 [Steroidobacteraceae bacterium]|nr:hypothetical protein [Steroidobacteraceae bacterium]